MNQPTQSNTAHGQQAPHTGPGDDPHYAYDSDMLPRKLGRRNGRSWTMALKACRANKRAHADAWERGDGEDVDEEYHDDDVEEKDYGVAEAQGYGESELGDDEEDDDDDDGMADDGYHLSTKDGEDAGEGPL